MLNRILEEIRKKKTWTLFTVFVLSVLVVIPFRIDNDFTISVFLWMFVYIALGSAWNLVGGYTGQIALSHGVFVAVGAYTAAILWVYYGITPWLAFIIAPIIAGCIGFAISYPTLKLKGSYFAMTTLVFGFIVWKLLLQWDYVRASVGINIPWIPSFSSMIFATPRGYYYISLVLVIGVVAFIYVIDRSKLGMYLKAIKQDEVAAENRGINVHKYKVYAMTISAALSSFGGIIWAQYVLYVDPNPFMESAVMSLRIALVVIVGGLGTVLGPILGGSLMIPIEWYSRLYLSGWERGGYSLLIYGVIIIVLAMYWPKGLVDAFDRIKKRVRGVTHGKSK